MHSTITRKTSKSIIDIDRSYNTSICCGCPSICCGPPKHCKQIHTLHTTERRQKKKAKKNSYLTHQRRQKKRGKKGKTLKKENLANGAAME